MVTNHGYWTHKPLIFSKYSNYVTDIVWKSPNCYEMWIRLDVTSSKVRWKTLPEVGFEPTSYPDMRNYISNYNIFVKKAILERIQDSRFKIQDSRCFFTTWPLRRHSISPGLLQPPCLHTNLHIQIKINYYINNTPATHAHPLLPIPLPTYQTIYNGAQN